MGATTIEVTWQQITMATPHFPSHFAILGQAENGMDCLVVDPGHPQYSTLKSRMGTLSECTHPNVLRFEVVEELADASLLVMTEKSGFVPLSELVSKQKKLKEEEARVIFRQLVDGWSN